MTEEVANIVREWELKVALVEEHELRLIKDEVLEIHGLCPVKKPDGVIRLLYENENGIDGQFKDIWKV